MAKLFQQIGEVVTYDIHLAGGKLPKDYEANVRIRMDCTGATRDQLIKVACTTSARVTLAKSLRELSTDIVDKYDRTDDDDAPVYEVKLVDIIAGANTVNPVDVILTMPKPDFVSMMMMEFGMNEPQAEKLYDKKHATK